MKSMYGLSLDAFLQTTYETSLLTQYNLWATYHSFGTPLYLNSAWPSIEPVLPDDMVGGGGSNGVFVQEYCTSYHTPSRFPFPHLSVSMTYIDAGITSMEHSLLDGIQHEADLIQQHNNRVFGTSQWVHDHSSKLSPEMVTMIKSLYPEIPSTTTTSTSSTTSTTPSSTPSSSPNRPTFKPLFYTGLLYFFIDSIANPSIDDLVTILNGFTPTIDGRSFEHSHYLWLMANVSSDPVLPSYSEIYHHLSESSHEVVLSEPCIDLALQPFEFPPYLQHVFMDYKSVSTVNDNNGQQQTEPQQQQPQQPEPPVAIFALIRAIQRGHAADILAPLFNLVESNGLTSTLMQWRLFIQRRSSPQSSFVVMDNLTTTSCSYPDQLSTKQPILPTSRVYSTLLSIMDILAVSTPILPIQLYQQDHPGTKKHEDDDYYHNHNPTKKTTTTTSSRQKSNNVRLDRDSLMMKNSMSTSFSSRYSTASQIATTSFIKSLMEMFAQYNNNNAMRH